MFTPSQPSPFLTDVPHFYTTTTFEPPPRLEAPSLPQDWVSFNALEGPGHEGFDTFRKTPLFQLAKQQFLDRIAQCEQFAHEHCTREERSSILDGLTTFRNHLLDGGGDPFFGSTLGQLYGSGKRHFDNFCLRLQQDIDLHQRKTALRELASELYNCRSTGPAFHDAAMSLDRAPGGLHGEFHALLMQRIDALLREVVNRPIRGVQQTPENVAKRLNDLRRMEVHMVNRLKLELDLPNVGALDHFVGATSLIETYQIDEAKDLLKAELRPVLLASELAERYRAQLRNKLPPEALADNARLSDHMAAIEQAQRAVNATFGPVSLHRLLTLDDETGECQWQEDLSLLAHDLLEALATQNLIVAQPCSSVLRDRSVDGIWDLMQVDWRLFLVEQRPTLTAAPDRIPVRMQHALKFMAQVPMKAPPAALTAAVLADTPENLRQMPLAWLTSEANLTRFCRSLGDKQVQTLIGRERPLDHPSLSTLLPTLTDLGMWRSLATVLTQTGHSSECLVQLGGGPALLPRALTQPSDQTRKLWLDAFGHALPKMSGDAVKAWFELPTGRIRRALSNASGATILSYLKLVEAAHKKLGFQVWKLDDLLRLDLQEMMKRGSTETLSAYADRLVALHLQGTLRVESLFTLLDGAERKGCSGALESGHKEVVEWYDQLVLKLHDQNVFQGNRVSLLLACTPAGQDSGALKAIRNGHAAALSAHFTQLQSAFEKQVFFPEEIAELLACRDANGRAGLFTMLEQSGLQPCLKPWRLAITEFAKTQRLPEHAVMGLLAPRTADGRHLLLNLFDGAGGLQRGKAWLAEAILLKESGVLADHALTSLLDGYPRAPDNWDSSLLLDLMQSRESPEGIKQLLALFGFAHKRNKLSDGDLAQLLIPIQGVESQRNIHTLEQLGTLTAHLGATLEGLLTLGNDGRLDGAPLLTLLHAIARLNVSSVSGPAASDIKRLIERLLATELATFDQRRIQGQLWGELLLNHDEPRAATADSREDAAAILNLLHSAVTTAEKRRMMATTEMAQYLREIRQLQNQHGQPPKPLPTPRSRVSPALAVQGATPGPSHSRQEGPPVAPRRNRTDEANTAGNTATNSGSNSTSTAAFHTRL